MAAPVSGAAVVSAPDLPWKRYLSYQKNFWGRESSAVTTDFFFLSPSGRVDAAAEKERSLEGFRRNEIREFEGRPQPLRCLFPYRAELLEELTGEKLPRPPCPDLDRWVGAVSAHKVSVVFAGAYTNNPASMFGHTFLRFSRFAGEDRSQILRSYSAGYMAAVPPEDGEAETIVKGLLGLYTGFFNVKPHYMNAALYNNSESRDLWEYPLKLTDEEVRRSVLLLWELMNFAGADYYFLDRNCSHRLLAFVETLRPDVRLTEKTGVFVLPLDTVRILEEAGLVDESGILFEPSLRRRINARLERMSPGERREFRRARRDPTVLRSVTDVRVLDTLVDDWTRRFYEKSAKLPPEQAELREETLRLRAMSGPSPDRLLPEELRPEISPERGHRTSWWEARAGAATESFLGFSATMGAHDLKASAKGYDGFAAIEYLSVGAQWEPGDRRVRSAGLRMADVAALNRWTREEPLWSWAFDGGLESKRDLPQGWRNEVKAGASFGMTFAFAKEAGLFAILPEVRFRGAGRDPDRGLLSAGARVIVRLERRDWLVLGDFHGGRDTEGLLGRGTIRIAKSTEGNSSLFIDLSSEQETGVERDSAAALGLRHFF